MTECRRRLIQLLKVDLGSSLSYQQFCWEFVDYYNHFILPSEFSAHELNSIKRVFDIAARYSPRTEDRSRFPVYSGEREVDRAVEEVRSDVQFSIEDYVQAFGVKSLGEGQALRLLGLVQEAQLPKVGELLLLAGFDSPELRRLAVEEGAYDRERLFRRAMESLAVGLQSVDEAALLLMLRLCKRIVYEAIDPYQGAKAVWLISTLGGERAARAAEELSHALLAWEAHPAARTLIEGELRLQTRRLSALN